MTCPETAPTTYARKKPAQSLLLRINSFFILAVPSSAKAASFTLRLQQDKYVAITDGSLHVAHDSPLGLTLQEANFNLRHLQKPQQPA